MKYKLLAIDLDDTLLNDNLDISKRNIDAIRSAERAGVKVTLATGRPSTSVKEYLDILGLNIPAITYQGAKIVDFETGKNMYDKELNLEQALPIIKFAEEMDIHCNIYIDDIIYIEKTNKWSELYHSLMPIMKVGEVGKLSRFLKEATTKVVLVDENDRLKNITAKAENIAGKDINVFMSKPNYLEFTNKYATKGAAVKFLAESFGIKRDEVMVIGDTYNDISMFEYAGLGVCMDNGPKDVKEIADYVTLSNNDDGVAHAIAKFI